MPTSTKRQRQQIADINKITACYCAEEKLRIKKAVENFR